MKTTIQTFSEKEIVQCDFCTRSTEYDLIFHCYGCLKDICRAFHTHYEDLGGDDYTVYLCDQCVDSFRMMNAKLRKVNEKAEEEKKRIEKEWRESTLQNRSDTRTHNNS